MVPDTIFNFLIRKLYDLTSLEIYSPSSYLKTLKSSTGLIIKLSYGCDRLIQRVDIFFILDKLKIVERKESCPLENGHYL